MDEPQRTVAGSFECAVQLSDRRTFKVTGYFFSDDDVQQMNRRVDMAQDVLDRQSIRADLVNKEAQIVGHTQNLESIRENVEGLLALQRDGKKLTSQQKQMVDNFDTTTRQAMKMIESLRAAIKEGRQKINGHAQV